MKLGEIASAIEAKLESGSPDTEISGVAGIAEAAPGELTFVASPKYAPLAKQTRASAIIVGQDFPAAATAMLRSGNPYLSFARALQLFNPAARYAPGIHPTAVIDDSAKIGANAHIGPYVIIGEGVEIGADSVLLSHVVIYRDVKIGSNFFAHAHSIVREGCRLGDHVTLQNGVVIGSDGFGFAKDAEQRWNKIPQPQPVVIGNHVEVQSNSCIDRSSVGQTQVGDGVKIDNLVQIGHGSKIGENSLLASQVGVAGSTEIGRRVILTGQAGVVGHCKVGDGAIVTPQSGVAGDIAEGAIVSGSPAVEHRAWLKYSAVLPRLPEMLRALRSRLKD